jgi:hypothetical protein
MPVLLSTWATIELPAIFEPAALNMSPVPEPPKKSEVQFDVQSGPLPLDGNFGVRSEVALLLPSSAFAGR